ncbi:hypothetical protein ON010_g5897 [Phytophthora cinnamomi]|nr:hypothetical protein ON010_g5897 [Phytophthora cinnamomi]
MLAFLRLRVRIGHEVARQHVVLEAVSPVAQLPAHVVLHHAAGHHPRLKATTANGAASSEMATVYVKPVYGLRLVEQGQLSPESHKLMRMLRHRRLFRAWAICWLSRACAVLAEMEGVEPSPEPPETRGVTVEQGVMLAADALFLFVGVVYGSRVLAPKPMTYLSEIAFPLDLMSYWCGALTGFWTVSRCTVVLCQVGCVVHVVPAQRAAVAVPGDFLLVAAVPSAVRARPAERCGYDGDIGLGDILWMEYRRGLTPSVYLRLFWFLKWLDATYFLVVNGTFAGAASSDDEGAMSYMTGMVFGGVCYAASAVLVLFMCVRPTTVTPEFIAYPTEVNTPSAYLNSAHCQPPTSLYGSFKDWELVAYPSSAKSTEERAMLDITIPATTSSIWGNQQFVSFKIVVQTDEDHWTLRRPYSDFAALDEEKFALIVRCHQRSMITER